MEISPESVTTWPGKIFSVICTAIPRVDGARLPTFMDASFLKFVGFFYLLEEVPNTQATTNSSPEIDPSLQLRSSPTPQVDPTSSDNIQTSEGLR